MLQPLRRHLCPGHEKLLMKCASVDPLFRLLQYMHTPSDWSGFTDYPASTHVIVWLPTQHAVFRRGLFHIAITLNAPSSSAPTSAGNTARDTSRMSVLGSGYSTSWRSFTHMLMGLCRNATSCNWERRSVDSAQVVQIWVYTFRLVKVKWLKCQHAVTFQTVGSVTFSLSKALGRDGFSRRTDIMASDQMIWAVDYFACKMETSLESIIPAVISSLKSTKWHTQANLWIDNHAIIIQIVQKLSATFLASHIQ